MIIIIINFIFFMQQHLTTAIPNLSTSNTLHQTKRSSRLLKRKQYI